jgi:hypothetical protein
MITKEEFTTEKLAMEKMLEDEKNNLEEYTKKVVMNVNKISAALQWINSELAKFPAEPEKKKSIFGKKK